MIQAGLLVLAQNSFIENRLGGLSGAECRNRS